MPMFKKMWCLVTIVCFVLIIGCTFDQIVTDKWGLLAVKNSARGFGYAISNTKSSLDDKIVVEAYGFFKSGNVDPVKLNEIISPFVKDPAYKLVVLAGFDLLEAMGATVVDGQIIDVSKIPPELWKTVETAYTMGYELGQSDKTKGITRAIP
jgi:hypothetical protein